MGVPPGAWSRRLVLESAVGEPELPQGSRLRTRDSRTVGRGVRRVDREDWPASGLGRRLVAVPARSTYSRPMTSEQPLGRPSDEQVLESERVFRSWLRSEDPDPLAYVE